MKSVPLTKGKHAIVDDEDYASVAQWKWYAQSVGNQFRAARRTPVIDGKRRVMYMSRFLMGVTDPETCVDHKNGDTLDNRRDNLRVANYPQNGANKRLYTSNKSGAKGVYWHSASRKWAAQIKWCYQCIYLGVFPTVEEARAAYMTMATKLYGEFANVP